MDRDDYWPEQINLPPDVVNEMDAATFARYLDARALVRERRIRTLATIAWLAIAALVVAIVVQALL